MHHKFRISIFISRNCIFLELSNIIYVILCMSRAPHSNKYYHFTLAWLQHVQVAAKNQFIGRSVSWSADFCSMLRLSVYFLVFRTRDEGWQCKVGIWSSKLMLYIKESLWLIVNTFMGQNENWMDHASSISCDSRKNTNGLYLWWQVFGCIAV